MTASLPRQSAIRPGAIAVALGIVLAACSGSGTAVQTPIIGPGSAAPAATVPSVAPASAAPSTGVNGCPTSQPAPLPAGQKRTVTIETAQGKIVLEIAADLSPIAAGNFVALAACGYYDGVVFHRLVPGFVIQGGDGEFGRVGADGKLPNPDRAGQGGPGYTIQDEPVTAQYGRGVVAMARTSAPNSVGSQFFIVLDDAARPALASANTYQIIGKVIAGMDVVTAIGALPNAGDAAGNAAVNPIPMTKVTVTTP
jgi:cyclophilin family peptidyl-prolyl cis-trans isomerase